MKTNSRQVKKPQKKGSSFLQSVILFTLGIIAVFLIQYAVKFHVERSKIDNKIDNSDKKAEQIVNRLKESIQNDVKKTNSITIPRRKKIAYAITITKDGFFQDGAAVLAYSIIAASKGKNYDISFIAFVHPNVTIARPFLRRLGFNVIEAPTPLNTSAITGNKFLREKIDKNGCCGATELIKLYSYRLTDFDKVVHLDADTIIINPIDELFESDKSLIYTTDPNMATSKTELGMPVQGGFIVLRPSIQDYLNIVHIVMTVPFRNGGGWNNSGVGWYWGGMTIQGVLAYYYYLVSPGRHLKLDRCIYNTMADTIPCSTQTLEEIKSAHFTVCQKPWSCHTWTGDFHEALCTKLHKRWFELRKSAEVFYGVPSVDNPCKKRSEYVPMELEHARVPSDSGLVAYNAPAKMDPLPGSGFVDIDRRSRHGRRTTIHEEHAMTDRNRKSSSSSEDTLQPKITNTRK